MVDADDPGPAVDPHDIEELPCHIPGTNLRRGNRRQVEDYLSRGGSTILLIRTVSQFEAYDKIISRINNTPKHPGRRQQSLCPAASIRRVGQVLRRPAQAAHAYHAAAYLLRMIGLAAGNPSSNRPVLLACVFATNAGPCYNFFRPTCTRKMTSNLTT